MLLLVDESEKQIIIFLSNVLSFAYVLSLIIFIIGNVCLMVFFY